MPVKFKKITELEITDKVLEIVKHKVENNEYESFDDLLNDLADLMSVFPKKDRVKALGIVGAVVVALTFIIKFFVV